MRKIIVLLAVFLCGCKESETPPQKALSLLSNTEPALLVSSGTNRYVLVHWNDSRWFVYPVVEQPPQ